MPDFRFLLPTINQLTPDQRQALISEDPIIVTGGPGSGKTAVSVLRLRQLCANDQNVLFFTYNRTLMAAIRGIARAHRFNPLNIKSFYEWYFQETGGFVDEDSTDQVKRRLTILSNTSDLELDEIIVDEAQDLGANILGNLNIISDAVSCGADRDQDIKRKYENDSETTIRRLLTEKQDAVHYLLRTNYRNTMQIFAFARAFVPDNPRPNTMNLSKLGAGDLPEVYSALSFTGQLQKLLDIVLLNRQVNIGIFAHTKTQVRNIKDYLGEHGVECSYYYNNMPSIDRIQMENNLQTPFITTLNSCKGLEFDIVILPFFEDSDYFLSKGYTYLSHYYVAATRSKRQLFLLCERPPAVVLNLNRDLYRHNGNAPQFNF